MDITDTFPVVGGHRPERTVYRPHDIHPTGNFASLCAKNGVRVSNRELRYFEQENFITPVLRIKRKVIEYRRVYTKSGRWTFNKQTGKEEWSKNEGWRHIPTESLVKRKSTWFFKRPGKGGKTILSECGDIDPKPYYALSHYFPHGELYMHSADVGSDHKGLVKDRDWLKQFRKQRRVASPNNPKFHQAALEEHIGPFEFVTNPSELGNPFEAFYPSQYFYAIYYVKRNLGKIIDTSFLNSEQVRSHIINTFNEQLSDDERQKINNHLAGFQEFLKFYLDVSDILKQTASEIVRSAGDVHSQTFNLWKQKGRADENWVRNLSYTKAAAAIEERRSDISNDLAGKLDEIYERHNTPISAVNMWQSRFVQCGIDSLKLDRKTDRAKFVSNQSDEKIAQSHICWRMAQNLGLSLQLREQNYAPVRELITGKWKK